MNAKGVRTDCILRVGSCCERGNREARWEDSNRDDIQEVEDAEAG